jgi:hypothetical protein
MIQELKSSAPSISFGFGLTETSLSVDMSVTVWLSTIYNQSVYSFQLVAAGATIIKVSNYEYRLTYSTPGSKDIYLNVSTKEKQTLKSNTITVIVK